MARFIIHVDMDAFFAAVEERDDPALKGRPIIVGADPKGGKGRGVVSTCSYAARRFGVHSAMPISTAWRLCPQGAFLPVDMEKYEAVSAQIYEIFHRFTPQVEPVSVDEAFLDMTGSMHLFATSTQACRKLKDSIKHETRLTASVGLAPNRFLAKLACELQKPDGLVELGESDVAGRIWPLAIAKMWGVGEKTATRLNAFGIHTIGDLAACDPDKLAYHFGRVVYDWHELAHGRDQSAVVTGEPVKSVSNEVTFDQDTFDQELIVSTFLGLCDKVSMRLRRQGLRGRTITLKLRLDDFSTFTRSLTVERPTNFCDDIFAVVKRLYGALPAHLKAVRLVGVKAAGFSQHDDQMELFGQERRRKQEGVHRAVEKIRDKFGDAAISRARAKLS